VILRCATTNAGKLREFRHAAGDIAIDTVPGLADIPAPDETGATFAENAELKALYYSRFTEDPVFADDSGLEVDALEGAPGVYSARFAGPDANDEDNNRLLLKKLETTNNRSARFVCVIALAQQGRLIATFRGAVEGRIIDTPRGDNGFGYDPLFFYEPFGCTFGEIDRERKMTVSHRGQALSALLTYCRETSSR
jgi:XTP/dITP diphosphohydrolase